MEKHMKKYMDEDMERDMEGMWLASERCWRKALRRWSMDGYVSSLEQLAKKQKCTTSEKPSRWRWGLTKVRPLNVSCTTQWGGERTNIHIRAWECNTDARLQRAQPFSLLLQPYHRVHHEESSSRVPAGRPGCTGHTEGMGFRFSSSFILSSSFRRRLLFSYSDEPVHLKYTRASHYIGEHIASFCEPATCTSHLPFSSCLYSVVLVVVTRRADPDILIWRAVNWTQPRR